jgi:hypothetical protein
LGPALQHIGALAGGFYTGFFGWFRKEHMARPLATNSLVADAQRMADRVANALN